MPQELNPGDKVVALAAAAQTAAVIAGAVSGIIAGRIAKHKVFNSVLAFIMGAIIGGFIGAMVGNILFPAAEGNVMIVKWGQSSLPFTIKGNIIASITSASAVCALMALITKIKFKVIVFPCLGTSVIIGLILAILSSLI